VTGAGHFQVIVTAHPLEEELIPLLLGHILTGRKDVEFDALLARP